MHRLQAENFVLFCIKFFLGENADINQFLQLITPEILRKLVEGLR